MYWLAEICVKRPIFALMLTMAMVVGGIVSYPQLGVDRFPQMDLPTAFVRVTYPGASPEEVESEVAQLIEDAVASVAGIDELRSISSEGSAIILVTFEINREIDAAVQDLRDAVGSVANRLPPGIDPPTIQKQDNDSSPIMSLALSGDRDSRELYFLADRFIKNVIESARGVGQVRVVGASERAMQIKIDSGRLAAYGISISQVREALVRQNADVPGGRVDAGTRELNLKTLGRLQTPAEFSQLTVATIDGQRITMGDLGEVEDRFKEPRTLARLNGQPAVILQVQRQSGTNTVEVIDAVLERLPRCERLLPDDVSIQVIQNQANYIRAALHEIQGHLVSGSILASVVVMIFMRSWQSTFISAVAIPASVITTFLFMRIFGFTLNNVTMLALVLMVGVVIDDAIVVLENVFRFIEEKKMDPVQASIEGTREIGLAVLATTISLVIVFLPVSFLASVTGRMLFQFGITATVAILVSMLISFTLTPMMCSKLLTRSSIDPNAHGSRSGPYRWVETGYMYLLELSMRHRGVILVLSIATALTNIPLYRLVKQDYIPTNVDESEFEVGVIAREGATLFAMDDTMRRVETEIRAVPGVELVLSSVGTRGFGGVNRGDIFVRIQEIRQRTFSFERLWESCWKLDPAAAWRGNFTQQQVMKQIRSRLAKVNDCRVSVRNQTSLRQGAPVDIDFTISGPNIHQLADFSEKVRLEAEKIPGIVDVDTTLRLDKPEWRVQIDRERAASMGVTVREIADTLRIAVGGDDRASRFRDPSVDDAFDVELRLTGVDRRDPETISQLFVRGATGDMIRIDNVVTFHYGESQSRIDRLDRERMVAVRANVATGYALGDRIEAIQKVANDIGVPAGFGTRVLGRGRELQRTLDDFSWTFVLSFVFMYIILAAQYEHLIHPFTVLLSLPLAVPFGLLSLYYGGETLNLYSAVGVLVLFGVVKKAAILQIDHMNVLRAQGYNRHDAIMQANRDRLRPILMTVVSFVAGLLPLLIATGPGAEERRSIAVLAVGGQTFSLLLTLLAIPVLYSYLDDIGIWLHRMLERKAGDPNPISGAAVPATESLFTESPLAESGASRGGIT